MQITFLGTRGYIKVKSRRHRRHTMTRITYKKTTILVDCGLDWLGKWEKYNPDAIILTHAHPDHAFGLQNGADCPVYATQESFNCIAHFPLTDTHIVKPGKKYTIGSMQIEPIFVVHSLRCPAVGYRITADNRTIFIAHDIISIPERHKALKNIDLYIGDGASITRPIIRRKDDKLFGHTTIRAQIGWCQKEKVPRAIFTHCGTQIVSGDERALGAKVRALGKERDVDARIAYDELEILL